MDLVSTVQTAFDAYRHLQEAHPLLGAIATAEVSFLSGDTIAQWIVNRKVDLRKSAYTAVLAPVYGLTMHGLVEAGNNIGELWEHVVERGAKWNYALTKAALGPNLEGLLFNAVFFLNNNLGERAGYHLGRVVGEYQRMFSHSEVQETGLKGRLKALRRNLHDERNLPKKEFMTACFYSLTLWNAFHAANYTWVPDELRTPASLAAAFLWTCVLSHWSVRDLRKRRSAEK